MLSITYFLDLPMSSYCKHIFICLPQLNTRLHEKGKSNRSTSIALTIIVVVALFVSGLPNMDSNTYGSDFIPQYLTYILLSI